MLATHGEVRAFSWREEFTWRNSIVSSDSHLEIGPGVVFLELWQFTSWLQSVHHVVNFFHRVGLAVSIKQLTGYGSEY